MIEIIIFWMLPILAIVLPWIISEIKFQKGLKELNEKFIKEAKRIDELEKTTGQN